MNNNQAIRGFALAVAEILTQGTGYRAPVYIIDGVLKKTGNKMNSVSNGLTKGMLNAFKEINSLWMNGTKQVESALNQGVAQVIKLADATRPGLSPVPATGSRFDNN